MKETQTHYFQQGIRHQTLISILKSPMKLKVR